MLSQGPVSTGWSMTGLSPPSSRLIALQPNLPSLLIASLHSWPGPPWRPDMNAKVLSHKYNSCKRLSTYGTQWQNHLLRFLKTYDCWMNTFGPWAHWPPIAFLLSWWFLPSLLLTFVAFVMLSSLALHRPPLSHHIPLLISAHASTLNNKPEMLMSAPPLQIISHNNGRAWNGMEYSSSIPEHFW